jgi:peptidoglycan hydrolase-like protein with peptidoglycan-binding domain/lysozyme family protein
MFSVSRRTNSARGGSPSSGPPTQAQPLPDHGNRAAIEEMSEAKEEPKFGVDESFTPSAYGSYYADNRQRIEGMSPELEDRGGSVDHVLEEWAENQERYEAVAEEMDLPAELVAALHYRESGNDFSRYLHNGDPLGQKTTRVPKGIGPFHTWEESANDALGESYKKGIQESLGLTADSTDLAAIATYAELYNGTGYSQRGLASPYAFAGTSAQDKGMYVEDSKFDANVEDQRLGVVSIVQLLAGDIGPEEGGQGAKSLGERILRQGERGADVRELQELLNAEGASLVVDGDFGPGTKAAVLAFQQEAGLTADGVVGPRTLTSLQAAETGTGGGSGSGSIWDEITDEVEATQEPERSVSLTEAVRGEQLRRGSSGPAVESLQQALVEAGHSLSVDGQFGRGTQRAVEDFQRARGLVVDGVVGSATAGLLEGGAHEREPAGSEESEGGGELVTRMGRSLLSEGSRGASVEALQQALDRAGHSLTVDGVFGPGTRQAVQAFQRAMGLIVDGVVGPQTRAALG